MSHRLMPEEAGTAAEAFRRSVEIFDAEPDLDAVAWKTKRGYTWIRRTADATNHLSRKEEPKPKLYRFDYQRAKSETPDQMPPDSEFQGVLKAWTESHVRRSARISR